jgi:ribonuclease HII
MKILGIDEAGRGPVIGPLVMCGYMIDEDNIPELKKLGVKDSKLLTAKSDHRCLLD